MNANAGTIAVMRKILLVRLLVSFVIDACSKDST